MIRAALTVEEALEGMKSLEPKIKKMPAIWAGLDTVPPGAK